MYTSLTASELHDGLSNEIIEVRSRKRSRREDCLSRIDGIQRLLTEGKGVQEKRHIQELKNQEEMIEKRLQKLEQQNKFEHRLLPNLRTMPSLASRKNLTELDLLGVPDSAVALAHIGLQNLECLEELRLPWNMSNLTQFIELIESWPFSSLLRYEIVLYNAVEDDISFSSDFSRAVKIVGLDNEKVDALPSGIEELQLVRSNVPSLKDAFPSLQGATDVKQLQSLELIKLPKLVALCKITLYLEYLEIECCDELKEVFSHDLLRDVQHLIPNLEYIRVSECQNLEELFVAPKDTANPVLALPKLRWLSLGSLPKLKSIYRGVLFCPDMQVVDICNCPNYRGAKELPKLLICDKSPSLICDKSPSTLASIPKVDGNEEWWNSLREKCPDGADCLADLVSESWRSQSCTRSASHTSSQSAAVVSSKAFPSSYMTIQGANQVFSDPIPLDPELTMPFLPASDPLWEAGSAERYGFQSHNLIFEFQSHNLIFEFQSTNLISTAPNVRWHGSTLVSNQDSSHAARYQLDTWDKINSLIK